MLNRNNFLVTDIQPPFIVHSKSGQIVHIENRVYYGLSLCMSGQITYTMNGCTYLSRPGSAVLLPQGGTYCLRGDQEGLFPVVNFKCENLNCTQITVLPLENPRACLKDFEQLRELSFSSDSYLRQYSIFYSLLDQVFPRATHAHPLIRETISYIEQNLSDPALSNESLAKALGISEVYLRKLFTLHSAVTPKQFILDLRIRKAKQLLTDTPFTVSAIAGECGFSSLYHFCRAFKQRTGMTPTQFATKNRSYKI